LQLDRYGLGNKCHGLTSEYAKFLARHGLPNWTHGNCDLFVQFNAFSDCSLMLNYGINFNFTEAMKGTVEYKCMYRVPHQVSGLGANKKPFFVIPRFSKI
jgi:hypothetical protein